MMYKYIAIIISLLFSSTLGHHELEVQNKAWIALGRVLDPSELDPPPLADDKNAAVAYQPLFDFLNGLTIDEQYLIGEDPTQVQGVEDLLDKCHDIIVHLRLVSQMPRCRWNVKYEDWLDVTYYHYGQSRQACRLLMSDARLTVSQGRDADAVRDIETIFRISQHMANDQTMIGQLVAGTEARIGTNIYEELFRDHAAPDNEIARLTAQFDSRGMFQRMLMCEVAMSEPKMKLLMSDEGWDGYKIPSISSQALLWDRVYFLRVMCGVVRDCDKPFYEAPIQDDDFPSYAITSRIFLPAYARAAQSLALGQLRMVMLQTAEELRSYKKEHGAYPEADAKDGVKMPIDPVTGKALAYKKTSQGFVLTSAAKVGGGKKIEWVWEK